MKYHRNNMRREVMFPNMAEVTKYSEHMFAGGGA